MQQVSIFVVAFLAVLTVPGRLLRIQPSRLCALQHLQLQL
jgi:hypothetical protein